MIADASSVTDRRSHRLANDQLNKCPYGKQIPSIGSIRQTLSINVSNLHPETGAAEVDSKNAETFGIDD